MRKSSVIGPGARVGRGIAVLVVRDLMRSRRWNADVRVSGGRRQQAGVHLTVRALARDLLRARWCGVAGRRLRRGRGGPAASSKDERGEDEAKGHGGS